MDVDIMDELCDSSCGLLCQHSRLVCGNCIKTGNIIMSEEEPSESSEIEVAESKDPEVVAFHAPRHKKEYYYDKMIYDRAKHNYNPFEIYKDIVNNQKEDENEVTKALDRYSKLVNEAIDYEPPKINKESLIEERMLYPVWYNQLNRATSGYTEGGWGNSYLDTEQVHGRDILHHPRINKAVKKKIREGEESIKEELRAEKQAHIEKARSKKST